MRHAKYTKFLTLAVSPELYIKIKTITNNQNISMSEWFRKVAETLIQQEYRCDLDSSNSKEILVKEEKNNYAEN